MLNIARATGEYCFSPPNAYNRPRGAAIEQETYEMAPAAIARQD